MTDIELSLYHHIEQAVANRRRSNAAMWRCAFHAHRVVGSGIEGATRELADRAGVTPEAVYRWQRGYRMWLEIAVVDYDTAKDLRRTLTVTHFAKMYDERQRYQIPTLAAESYLSQLVVYQAEEKPHSVAVLSAEIAADHRQVDGPVIEPWEQHRDAFRSRLQSALLWRDVPEPVARLVRRLLEELG